MKSLRNDRVLRAATGVPFAALMISLGQAGCVGTHQSATADSQSPASMLDPGLAPLAPYIGSWRIRTTMGSPELGGESELFAYTMYEPAVGGDAVRSTTWVSDNGEPVEMRYRGTAVLNPDSGEIEFSIEEIGEGELFVAYTPSEFEGKQALIGTWFMDGAPPMNERLWLASDDELRWQLLMQIPGMGEQMFVDATWQRVSREPIAYDAAGSLPPDE